MQENSQHFMQKENKDMILFTRDNEQYYFYSKDLESMKKSLSNDKFIEINGVILATWNIKKIERRDSVKIGEIKYM